MLKMPSLSVTFYSTPSLFAASCVFLSLGCDYTRDIENPS